MSIGISGKIFGKGWELYLGKTSYTHTLTLVKVTVVAFDEVDFTSLEVAIRW